jgi:tetratricopeptide (TPR) repeat protein
MQDFSGSMRVPVPRRAGVWAMVASCALLVGGCGGGARDVGGTGPGNGTGGAENPATGTEGSSVVDGAGGDKQPEVTNGPDGTGGDPETTATEATPGTDAERAQSEGAEARASATATSQSVVTKADRIKMSEFLVEPAGKAKADPEERRAAVAMYQALVVARGPGSPAARELAEVWALAGEHAEAVAVLDDIIASTEDPEMLNWAREQRPRWAELDNPFKKDYEPARVTRLATRAFESGRKEYKKKNYADALVYFEMGYALDPDLPGFLREIGSVYDKLGAPDKKREFYFAYLRRRPFGKNADEIRNALAKDAARLGTLTIKSALPCQEFWMEGMLGDRSKKGTTKPLEKLLLPPGTYQIFCTNFDYTFGYFDFPSVKAGEHTEFALTWAVLINQLDDPRGRIRIEDALNPGVMLDLGLHARELGVVVPRDGRALKVELRAIDNSRPVEERYLRLQPGSKEVIKWSP